MSTPYPWQAAQWRHLWLARHKGRMPHAVLLHGNRGSGVSEFAQRFAVSLLCHNPLHHEGTPCGACKSCFLFKSGNHPEFLMLSPEGNSKAIKIDQVRRMVQFVSLTSHYGYMKVILLEPAETMNRHTANSLLKTLEEPPPETQFILVSHTPMLLPVTIRSRCQTIRFDNPAKEPARQWLAGQVEGQAINIELLLGLADNSPLEALEMICAKKYESRSMVMDDLECLASGKADPIEVANRWLSIGMDVILLWLWKLLEDLIRLQCTQTSARIQNRDFRDRLEKLAASLKKSTVFAAYDQLKSYRQLVNSASNVTPLILMEDFTTQWSTGND